MMIKELEGIVLNTKDYKESSKILDVFTKEYGVIGVISKGCKSLKSNLRSVSDKFIYAKFNIYYKKDKLSTLNEASVINNFNTIKKDIKKISYASYILDLTYQVYRQSNELELYDLLINSLIKINENFDPLIITNILELKYLNYLGIMPNLNECSVCGSKSVITLSSDRGGFICTKCRTIEPIISNKAIKLIRLYYYVDIEKISKLDIDSKVVEEINLFLDEYYDRYTGLYLRSKQFLKQIL